MPAHVIRSDSEFCRKCFHHPRKNPNCLVACDRMDQHNIRASAGLLVIKPRTIHLNFWHRIARKCSTTSTDVSKQEDHEFTQFQVVCPTFTQLGQEWSER